MKKLILSAVVLLFINATAFGQAQNNHKPPCEDCSRFPYKPSGCNYNNCLEQLLSVATREDLLAYFALPGNVCDKIIFMRNRGVKSMQDYRMGLEEYEYSSLMHGYANYVKLRTPVTTGG